jgi:hypothetical protein
MESLAIGAISAAHFMRFTSAPQIPVPSCLSLAGLMQGLLTRG